jgi:PAS domain S-box-containing protein
MRTLNPYLMMALITTEDYLAVAGVMIVVLDRTGKVEKINKKGCEILGYERKEIISKNWFDQFLPPEARRSDLQQFRYLWTHADMLSQGQESRILTCSGEERLIQWDNTLIKNEAGEVVAMLRSGEDITEKRLLQKRLAAAESEKRKGILSAVLEAQEKERHQIASDLHDGICQVLTTCKLLLETEMQQGSTSPLVANTFRHLVELIGEVRQLSHRLNPAQLEDLGLEGAILELVEKINLCGTLKVELCCDTMDRVTVPDKLIALSLFRIVQEQVSNIIKHAEATKVTIQLNLSASAVELEITDNGKGFDKGRITKGLGLKNMYSRVDFHGGKALILSAPGEGCTLSVYVPLGAV